MCGTTSQTRAVATKKKDDAKLPDVPAEDTEPVVEPAPLDEGTREKIRRATTSGLRAVLANELPPEIRSAVVAELESRDVPAVPPEPVWIVQREGFVSRDGMLCTVAAGTAVSEREAQRYRDMGFELAPGVLRKWEDQLGFIHVAGVAL